MTDHAGLSRMLVGRTVETGDGAFLRAIRESGEALVVVGERGMATRPDPGSSRPGPAVGIGCFLSARPGQDKRVESRDPPRGRAEREHWSGRATVASGDRLLRQPHRGLGEDPS